MWKLMMVLMAVITIARAYPNPTPKMYQHVRTNNPSPQYYDRAAPPQSRSSFGGSSFHGGASTVELNPVQQPRIQNYSVLVGQGLGAHRSEYSNKRISMA